MKKTALLLFLPIFLVSSTVQAQGLSNADMLKGAGWATLAATAGTACLASLYGSYKLFTDPSKGGHTYSPTIAMVWTVPLALATGALSAIAVKSTSDTLNLPVAGVAAATALASAAGCYFLGKAPIVNPSHRK